MGTRTNEPTLEFYEGKCQEKYFRAELKPGETSPSIQPLVGGVLLRCDGAASSPTVGGGRRLLVSMVWLSLLMGRVVQNGPEPSRARR